MGQGAEDILNGDVDQYTGEWIGNGQGYPRSMDQRILVEPRNEEKFSKSTKGIRKELAILIKNKLKEIPDHTDKQENKIVGECRQAMNLKYGKGWREQF